MQDECDDTIIPTWNGGAFFTVGVTPAAMALPAGKRTLCDRTDGYMTCRLLAILFDAVGEIGFGVEIRWSLALTELDRSHGFLIWEGEL